MAEIERNAARGIFRDQAGWVTVDHGVHRNSIPRHRYEEMGYEPPFESLPTKEEYDARK